MTEKEYDKLIKRLEKDYELLRTIDSNTIQKKQEFLTVKARLYRVIRVLKDNEYLWAKCKR